MLTLIIMHMTLQDPQKKKKNETASSLNHATASLIKTKISYLKISMNHPFATFISLSFNALGRTQK